MPPFSARQTSSEVAGPKRLGATPNAVYRDPPICGVPTLQQPDNRSARRPQKSEVAPPPPESPPPKWTSGLPVCGPPSQYSMRGEPVNSDHARSTRRRAFLQAVAAGVLGKSVTVGLGASAVSAWTGQGTTSVLNQARPDTILSAT